jgi:hypothetical protein
MLIGVGITSVTTIAAGTTIAGITTTDPTPR